MDMQMVIWQEGKSGDERARSTLKDRALERTFVIPGFTLRLLAGSLALDYTLQRHLGYHKMFAVTANRLAWPYLLRSSLQGTSWLKIARWLDPLAIKADLLLCLVPRCLLQVPAELTIIE